MHEHEHGQMSEKEAIASLKFMIEHNEHHESELHDIGHSLPEEAGDIVHEALQIFKQGNTRLKEALQLLEENE